MAEDEYVSFEQLRVAEWGKAWQVVHEARGIAVVIVAAHAGGIERGTFLQGTAGVPPEQRNFTPRFGSVGELCAYLAGQEQPA